MKHYLVAAAAATFVAASAADAQSQVFAIDLRQGTPSRLLSFPVNAPAQNVLSSTATFDGFAMDFNSAATTLYGIQASTATASPNFFGTIDTTTGNFSPIAALTGLPAGSAGGMSVDPTTETFYVNDGATLYTLNTTTGALTSVGGFGTGLLNIDIAIDRNGQMYGHDIGADNLLLIDKTTGAATVIGPTGHAANFAQGMDFDYETNTLYATIYTGGGTGVFASFNLTTGAGTTILSTTSWNAEMEMAVASPIPEPTSFALMGMAGAALLRRRRA